VPIFTTCDIPTTGATRFSRTRMVMPGGLRRSPVGQRSARPREYRGDGGDLRPPRARAARAPRGPRFGAGDRFRRVPRRPRFGRRDRNWRTTTRSFARRF